MADFINSANMTLPIPVVSVAPGPDWADDYNACLTIIDAHDHSAGYGVPINPNGLNINSDLSFGGNNLTTVKSVRFQIQSSPLGGASDLGCLYESGVDLYYNDGNGNQVRITQSGGVAGSPGSIASLSSPASATYVSANQTFVWQSAANTPANMDGGSVLIRNILANSKALTLSAPAAMGSNYTVTLPSLPASQKFMTLDASGNMSAPWAVDNSSIEISSNTVQVKDSGITTAKLADGSVTEGKLADGSVTQAKLAVRSTGSTVSAGGFAISSEINFLTGSGTYVDITNATVTITTDGSPVFLGFQASSVTTGEEGYILVTGVGTTQQRAFVRFVRDSTALPAVRIGSFGNSGTTTGVDFPPSTLFLYDTPSAGTYTYKAQARFDIGDNISFNRMNMIAYEI